MHPDYVEVLVQYDRRGHVLRVWFKNLRVTRRRCVYIYAFSGETNVQSFNAHLQGALRSLVHGNIGGFVVGDNHLLEIHLESTNKAFHGKAVRAADVIRQHLLSRGKEVNASTSEGLTKTNPLTAVVAS